MITAATGGCHQKYEARPVQASGTAEALVSLEDGEPGQLGPACPRREDLHLEALAADVVVEGHQYGEPGRRFPAWEPAVALLLLMELLFEPVLGADHQSRAVDPERHGDESGRQAGEQIRRRTDRDVRRGPARPL